jgi:hypothetical protein
MRQKNTQGDPCESELENRAFVFILSVFAATCCRGIAANNRMSPLKCIFGILRFRKDLGVFGLVLPMQSAPRKYTVRSREIKQLFCLTGIDARVLLL